MTFLQTFLQLLQVVYNISKLYAYNQQKRSDAVWSINYLYKKCVMNFQKTCYNKILILLKCHEKYVVLLYLAVYDHHKKKKAVLIELGTYRMDGQWCCFSMESCSLFICSVHMLAFVYIIRLFAGTYKQTAFICK